MLWSVQHDLKSLELAGQEFKVGCKIGERSGVSGGRIDATESRDLCSLTPFNVRLILRAKVTQLASVGICLGVEELDRK